MEQIQITCVPRCIVFAVSLLQRFCLSGIGTIARCHALPLPTMHGVVQREPHTPREMSTRMIAKNMSTPSSLHALAVGMDSTHPPSSFWLEFCTISHCFKGVFTIYLLVPFVRGDLCWQWFGTECKCDRSHALSLGLNEIIWEKAQRWHSSCSPMWTVRWCITTT